MPDIIYVFAHHDEMYFRYDVVGDEINSFFKTARFTADAQRGRCSRYPFQ